MNIGLTGRQNECLKFIQNYVEVNEIPPSYGEIATALGLNSKSGVHRMINELQERGVLYRRTQQSRSITLLDSYRVDRSSSVITIQLETDVKKRAKVAAKRKGITFNEYVSDAIRILLELDSHE